jgi:hypothetical protein
MYQLWYPDALWLWILTANKNVVSDIYAHTHYVCILPGTQFVPFYGPSGVVVIYFSNCNTIMKMLTFFWYGIQYSYTLYRWVYEYCCHIICDTVQSDRSELAFQWILPYNFNIL